MEEFSRPALARLLPLLHHTSRCLLAALDGPAPGGLLVCGPAGSGRFSASPEICSTLSLVLHDLSLVLLLHDGSHASDPLETRLPIVMPFHV